MSNVHPSDVFDHITTAYDQILFTTVTWPEEANAGYVLLTLSQHGQDITPDTFKPYRLTPDKIMALLKLYSLYEAVSPSQRAWATALRTVPDFIAYCDLIDDRDSINAFCYWIITHFATPIV